jgi:hypothetical protein
VKKSVIGLCLLLVLTGLALPQNKKGTWFLGTSIGSAGYSFSHSESGSTANTNLSLSDYTSFSFSIYPTIGYYLLDDLVLGAYFSLGFSNYNYDSSYNYSSSTSKSSSKYLTLSIGPFIRYYLGKEGGKGRPYLHAYVQPYLYPIYGGDYTPSTGTAYTYQYKNYLSLAAGIQLGYEHYLNPTIGLQYYVGYTFSSYSYNTEYDYPTGPDSVYTYKSNSHGFSFGVGLQIHLSPEKK